MSRTWSASEHDRQTRNLPGNLRHGSYAAVGPNTVEFEFVSDDRGVVTNLIRHAQGGADVRALRKGR
jgi:hypothetical protein